jgi:hypothetical protein
LATGEEKKVYKNIPFPSSVIETVEKPNITGPDAENRLKER